MNLVLGYHGCNQRTAQSLLSSAQFVPSDKPYDWLGSGIYFWEADPLRAYEWARQRHGTPGIVGAAIDLGLCLDLTTRGGAESVRRAFRSYSALQQRLGRPLAVNRASARSEPQDRVLRYLDQDVINHLHARNHILAEESGGLIPEFDTVRALFPEGKPLYEGAGFWENTHIQIAVRNLRQIRGVFRVPSSELDELGIAGVYDF